MARLSAPPSISSSRNGSPASPKTGRGYSGRFWSWPCCSRAVAFWVWARSCDGILPRATAMAEPHLHLQGLCKSFGSLVVTDDVTLDVHAGEMHALIGPNGAGKTTLIDQMSGLIAPDAGTVVFAGDDITALPPQTRALRGMSRTFQISSILPGFAVLENVALAVQARTGSSFRFFGSAAAEPALNIPAMAALETAGIVDRANARAGELSHG